MTRHNSHNGLWPAPTCYIRTCCRLVTGKLRGNWCNGFWPLSDNIVGNVEVRYHTSVSEFVSKLGAAKFIHTHIGSDANVLMFELEVCNNTIMSADPAPSLWMTATRLLLIFVACLACHQHVDCCAHGHRGLRLCVTPHQLTLWLTFWTGCPMAPHSATLRPQAVTPNCTMKPGQCLEWSAVQRCTSIIGEHVEECIQQTPCWTNGLLS